MQVRVLDSIAGYGPGQHPNRSVRAWSTGEIVDVDDTDLDAVAFYDRWVENGTAELVNASPPDPAPARRTVRGPAPDKSRSADGRQAVQRTRGNERGPGGAGAGGDAGGG